LRGRFGGRDRDDRLRRDRRFGRRYRDPDQAGLRSTIASVRRGKSSPSATNAVCQGTALTTRGRERIASKILRATVSGDARIDVGAPGARRAS